jgi:hypothetical protein
MPLISFWKSTPEAVGQMTIEQIVSAAGDGNLRDGSACSDELRTYLGEVLSVSLESYIEYCLTNAFKIGGIVLQDLVNEVGRRLDYEVRNGRYQGTPSHVGYDGLWKSPEGNALVIEVKTTDAYRISLDTIARYREKLIAAGEIDTNSSILIVVGRQDTGELEAQIRGSRHAWDVRVISAEALMKLLKVKENSNEAETGAKVRSLFAPVEYTRLDRMVDVVFTAATDVEVTPEVGATSYQKDAPGDGDPGGPTGQPTEIGSGGKTQYQFTDSAILQTKRLSIIDSLGARDGVHLIQKSRAQYWNSARDVRAVCSISKRYEGKNQYPYWYAYHPQWDDFLAEAERGYFVLGCMDLDRSFAIPLQAIRSILPALNQSSRDSGKYWHVHLVERNGGLEILIPNSPTGFPLEQFSVPIRQPRLSIGEPVR